MNYQQQLMELKATDYVNGGYPETMAAARPIIDDLIEELIRLDQAAIFRQKLEIFLHCQKRLNTLMMAEGVRADRVERDIFYSILENVGTIVGMNGNEGNAIEFIEVLDSEEEM